jgi:predicted ATPase
VALFVERAAAASGSFEPTAGGGRAVPAPGRAAAGDRAGGGPRAPLSPERIGERLSDRFGLLTGGSRAAHPRQQTLRTTIEWSYDLLAPAERTPHAR